MADGNSQSTPAHAPAAAADWETRARRLEALCGLATESASMVDADRIWDGLCKRLPPVLGAGAAALSTPLIEQPRAWVADEWSIGADELTALVTAPAGEGGRVEVGGGAGFVFPLHHAGEAVGTLLVAWRTPGEADDEMHALAGMLAGQAAAGLANARAYARLTEAAVRRERFFSAMSHDLRTPITAIVGYSELLADGIVGELNGQQHDMVERICQVSGHLSQLVNDILDLAKLDAGRMEFNCEEVTLGALVDDALVVVEPQARSKGLDLRTEVDPLRDETLCVDPPRVRQVLVNLLSNAVKFTAAGAVSVAAGCDEGGRAWIEVRDTGPGLPFGSEEAVFEEFLQLGSAPKSKGEPGSGLGLAISRRLARAMGGDLVARNAPPAGAAFTFVLPARGE
ncbi:HAMP domain-containing sensor histidine kinase [Longimicrobium sp.]|jgi:signal transduction histidine kinase|uniref:sensor histidine kinase n=1 Tax=Longimicrobium sp. TaxID=2029185 RepID=UPI002ED783B7